MLKVELKHLTCWLSFLLRGSKGWIKYALKIDRLDFTSTFLRRRICYDCHARTSDHWWARCSVCGCWLMAKTAVGKEQCRLGKWRELQKQSNDKCCLITAFAMCINIPVNVLLTMVGNSDIGHHPQEIIDLALKLGYAMVEHNPKPYWLSDFGYRECIAYTQPYELPVPGIMIVEMKKHDHALTVIEDGSWIDPSTACKVYWPDVTMVNYYSVHKIEMPNQIKVL